MKPKGRSRKPQPATPSLFEWGLTLGQKREVEPVSRSRETARHRGSHRWDTVAALARPCVRPSIAFQVLPPVHVCGFFLLPGKAGRRLLPSTLRPASTGSSLSCSRVSAQSNTDMVAGYRPFTGLALRVDRPCFNQDRFDFGSSAFHCDGERS